MSKKNHDHQTILSFGDEWTRFDQSQLSSEERERFFSQYFKIFPWDNLPSTAVGADIGCGSGRWADIVASKVGYLHCVDASYEALTVAKNNLQKHKNIEFHHGGIDNLPFSESSLDFCYSLGVLHHVPDTAAAIKNCARFLKPGAPMLVYIYYAMDNRPAWYKYIWQLSDYFRKLIYRLPKGIKTHITNIIATLFYYPLARLSLYLEKLGINVENLPLSTYREASFYTMRTDARDRFGTPLEKRFSLNEIKKMMASAGLVDLKASTEPPFWCVVGQKSA